MSISNHQQLEHAQRQMARLQSILEGMCREESTEAYAILSKGYVEQIEKIRREIDEYVGSAGTEHRQPVIVSENVQAAVK